MASSLEERIKSALAAGDFNQAEGLMPAYIEEIASLLSAPSSGQAGRQAVDGFQNLLSLAQVMRAHISAQLSQLQRQASYRYQVPTSDQHAWRFEA